MESQLLEMGQLSLPMLECREFVFWLPLPSPSIREALLPPSPLRTARASFPACRSSLSNAPCATRFRYGETLAMQSLMAFWVEQDAIVCLISASVVVEGQIHRLKLLERQSYGHAGFDLLRHRVLARPA
jgi:hypothetical protein